MEKTPANDILFRELCTLLEQLSKRKKHRQDQDKMLSNFINDFRINSGKVTDKKNSSFFPVLRLLLPDRDRERSPYNLKETKLGSLLVKVLSLNKQSHDAQELLNFRSVHNSAHDSDFAGVAYFVLKNRMTQKSCSLTIGDINKVLDRISSAEVGNKGPVLDDAFSFIIKNLTAEQLKWFLRIILKDLKLAIGTHRTLAAFHPDAPELLDSCGNLSKVCEDLADGDTRPIELGVKVFYAVSPMLSERLDITRISQLSSDKTYQIEDKFDGERFQIHMEDDVFEYFSRKGFAYSSNYGKTYDSGLLTPHLKDCFSPDVKSCILDGEMMGWHKEYRCFGSKGMAFDIKKITENSKFRPCFCAFDVLYYNGKSLIGPPDKGGKTLKERQKILDSMFVNLQGVILRSKRQIMRETVDVLNALNKAIENQDEGIVVKDVDSYYIANRRNAGWYKIKPEYTEGAMTDLDLVVIGADEAENKRQGRAKSFHVACLDNTGPAKRWVAVGRVATGLTFDEREKLCALLEQKWTIAKRTPPPSCLFFNKDKPDFWILPEYSVVLEVRATELVRSSSSGTDYTLRFPRVMKVRSDKPVNDVLTLEEFQRLVAEKNAVIKLSTKRISEDQIDAVLSKTRRTRTSKAIQVSDKFRTKQTGDVHVTSSALRDREVCVLSGDGGGEGGRGELVRIVEMHGGKHVVNPGPKTWCSVAGTLSFRIRKLIESNKFDIITASWLRNLAISEFPCSLSPLDMLSIKKETKVALSLEFDPYGDSYKEPIDEDTLKKCLTKMDNEDPIYPTTQEMVQLDQQLFGENNPFSFLRQCSIHFMNDPIRSALAKIYGARICDKSDFLTHIVISKETDRQELHRINNNGDVKIVSEEWFDKCLEMKKLVPVS
ncbi:DNA ligase 4-like isoform X2 [Colias croceus]|nr:DNA ligase 4-like isoform X2 [Colias croceus]XP_045490988.1 DNA ligase 4-like isoform X2 [Colias croceus]XP_045490997.1 DNA ligase 4-like isoform X2 [Colias croceus]